MKGFLARKRHYLLDRYAFDKVCRVMYVSKAKNHLGDRVEGSINEGDLVVVGLVQGNNIYRALAPKALLDSFPVNNLHYGLEYRFQSKHKPLIDDNNEIVWLDNVVPSRDFFSKFF